MAKLLGIVRYEILMGWRRGSSRMILLVPILMPILGFVLFTSTTFRDDQIANSQLSVESAKVAGTAITLMDTLFLVPLMIFLVPVLVAEVIPLDRQYKMSEILRALPLSIGTYLTGKVLSVLLQVIATVAATALISVLIQLFRKVSVDVGTMVVFWLGGMLALGIFSSIAGVLIPALQPTRRRAVLLGWVVALTSLGVYAMLPIHATLITAMIHTVAISASTPINPVELPAYPTLFSGTYLRNYQILAAVLVLLWAFMAWRLRNSDPAR